MSDPLQKAVQMLDRELENNSKLRKKNNLLTREVRQLKVEVEKRVVMHPELFNINNMLISTEETTLKLVHENAKLIFHRDNKKVNSFFQKLRRLF